MLEKKHIKFLKNPEIINVAPKPIKPLELMPLLKRGFQLYRLWPTDDPSILKYYMAALSYLFIFSIPMALHVINHLDDFSDATLAMSEFTSTISFYFKISVFIFHMPLITSALIDLESILKNAVVLNTDSWKKICDEYEKITNRNTKIVIGWYSFTVFAYTILPYCATFVKFVLGKVIHDETFSLGIHVELYGLRYQNDVYTYLWIGIPYGLAFLILCNLYGFIALFMPFMMNAVAIVCQYLQLRIIKFDEESKNLTENDAWKLLSEIIQEHQFVLRIAENLEKSFNVTYLAQFTLTMFVSCFILFDLNILLSKPFVLVNLVAFFTVLQIDLLFSSYYGQKLIVESEKISHVLYLTDWYTKSIKIQKVTALMMLRGQKRIKITAGKFYTLSYETYRQSLQSIFSYYLILRKIYAKIE